MAGTIGVVSGYLNKLEQILNELKHWNKLLAQTAAHKDIESGNWKEGRKKP